jgi:deoxyribodipyrimidine photo-lyase
LEWISKIKKMTQHTATSGVIYWFRHDLRLHDNSALQQAIALAKQHHTWLLPVYVHDTALQLTSPWGFVRTSEHRLAWTAMAVHDVSEQLSELASQLLQITGEPSEVLAELMTRLGASTLVCEDIAAPYEEAHIQALRQRGLDVQTVWQSTLMAPDQLPFEPHEVPDEFSSFRRAVERQTFAPVQPVAAVTRLPALPDQAALDSVREMQHATEHTTDLRAILKDPRSAFP